MRKSTVSVITVCLNSAETIAETIESVLSQTLLPDEYIVIDGVSKDKTNEIVSSYAADFERKGIKLIHVSEPDKGLYDAMNKGINIAKGSLTGILNSDDRYEKNTVEQVCGVHEQHPESVIYGMLRMIKKGKVYHVKQHTHHFLNQFMPQHPTWFVPKVLYEKHGVFDTTFELSADYELANRFYKAGADFQRIESVLTNFRMWDQPPERVKKGSLESLKIKYLYGHLSEKHYAFQKFKIENSASVQKLIRRYYRIMKFFR